MEVPIHCEAQAHFRIETPLEVVPTPSVVRTPSAMAAAPTEVQTPLEAAQATYTAGVTVVVETNPAAAAPSICPTVCTIS